MQNPFYQKYEIQGVLGQGGQGVVELCKNKLTNQLFAVKKTSGDLNQLQNEIDIQSSVQSKYIVKMIEVISHESFLYIVLEYCNGKTLWEKAKNKSFSEADIYEFLNLSLEHNMNLFKWEQSIETLNLIIFQFMMVNINQLKQLTQFQISTYRSPQMESGKYTSKCDVWSLGIIIYYLLFKKYPWRLDQHDKQKYYNDCKNLTFPQERVISLDLKELIEGCLAFEEKDRFSWTDLMKTRNLGFQFDDYVKLEQTLKHVEAQLIQRIILRIIQNDTTVQAQFQADNRENAPNYRVRFFDFQRSIKKYDQQLAQFHIVYIFNQIDQKHKNYIDDDQFEKWIKRCNETQSIIQNLQIQEEAYPPLNRIHNIDDRLKIKQLFVIIYFQIQQNDYNIWKLVERHEKIDKNRKIGIILASEFVNVFKEIDKKISQDYIQIAKQYITQGQHIKNDRFVDYYQAFQTINLTELSLIYQLLTSFQLMKFIKEEQFEGYLNFINLFDKKTIDQFVSLDLQSNKPQENNLEDLKKDIQRIKVVFNIQY